MAENEKPNLDQFKDAADKSTEAGVADETAGYDEAALTGADGTGAAQGDATGGAQADSLGDPSNSGEMPGEMPGEQPVEGEHDPQAPTEKRAAGHTSEANPN